MGLPYAKKHIYTAKFNSELTFAVDQGILASVLFMRRNFTAALNRRGGKIRGIFMLAAWHQKMVKYGSKTSTPKIKLNSGLKIF